MLIKLCIQNIALIEYAEIDFDQGLNILSGETGAGKSIIIDSMNLALGMRADRDIIKTGCTEAVVEAVFDISGLDGVKAALAELDMEESDELILTRRLTGAGRNICRVNGYLVPLNRLRGITRKLVDILGQHEHQSLLDESLHLDMLDAFGGQPVTRLLEQARADYAAYAKIRGEMKELYGSTADRLRRADILRYQIEEIDKAALRAGEEETLQARMEFLKHAADIVRAVERALDLLYHGRETGAAALDLTGEAGTELGHIAHIAPEYLALQEKTEQVYYQLEDLTDQLRELSQGLEYDDNEMDALVERSEQLKRLMRKYGRSVQEVLAAREQMARELDGIENADARLEEMTQNLERSRQKTVLSAQALSRQRKESARNLEKELIKQLGELGMEHARFKVDFAPVDDISDALSARGIDTVRFLISPNPGEELKPLSHTASGGEMSRIMLALKNIAAGADAIPTLIFDEIDTGISGTMARVVAEKLSSIARQHQVICVTHTAVIAAMGDHHFYIEKQTDGKTTATSVTCITGEERVREIGRLVGGEITTAGLEHARQMLQWSQRYKQKQKEPS